MYYIMYSELTTIILGEKLHTDILVSTFPYLRIYLNAFAADAGPGPHWGSSHTYCLNLMATSWGSGKGKIRKKEK